MISYGLILILAINLGYLVVLEPLSIGIQISIHLGGSLMIVVIMFFTIRRKSKKYDQELKPIIESLEQMLLT
jgi:membrane associated rhomboid family serine protease